MRRVLAVGVCLIVGRFFWKCCSNVQRDQSPSNLTPEKVKFIEEKTSENFAFIMESYDQAKREGNNVLQWLFGAMIGGIGLVGTLAKNDYWCLAFGGLIAAGWAGYLAAHLIRCIASQEMNPPGNRASALNDLLEEPEYRMRWREAKGLSLRADQNLETVGMVAIGVDKARNGLTWIPVWFLGASTVAWCAEFLYKNHLFEVALRFMWNAR